MADVDGDGDADVIATSNYGSYFDSITWFENTDGLGSFGPPRVVSAAENSLEFATAGDLDGDGDIDVLAITVHASQDNAQIAWYENVDGQGSFGQPRLITISADYAKSVVATDVDGDGNIDVLSASQRDDTIAWYENRPIGDSNNDGVFDSKDLVAVFQANEYEDRIPNNSTFDEGDWNGDGEFDSSDFVVAFQAGTYSTAANRSDVAASIDAVFGRDRKVKAFVP